MTGFALEPSNFKKFTHKLIGFDIETYDDNKEFLCASVYSKDFQYSFTDKQEAINFFKSDEAAASWIVATNLSFDFFGLFHNMPEMNEFDTLFRGSGLLYAKTNTYAGKLTRKRVNNHCRPLVFIDTLNYAKMSVEQMGKLLKIPKLKNIVEDIIGKKPSNEEEWQRMIEYNMMDAKISHDFMEFLIEGFEELGATVKMTLASTAMSLFRNKYLKEVYWRMKEEDLMKCFNGYYGAMTNAYVRGHIENMYYYDVNSLYPSVMAGHDYPDPNFIRRSKNDSMEFILGAEGISNVDILSPPEIYPFLPWRFEGKTIFPYGRFTGTYTHAELRHALLYKYKIEKVNWSVYSKKTCRPFDEYIKDLYSLRLKYQKTNNPMQAVVKLFMNGLYGKFGQKFKDRDNWIPIPTSIEELHKINFYDRIGNYIRIKNDKLPAAFCIPLWSAYVTSYGRMRLHDLSIQTNPYYVDTDSLITSEKIMASSDLGKLKLEYTINSGIILKPKMYMLNTDHGDVVRAKGLGIRMSKDMFMEFLNIPTIKYKKFLKPKESWRRGLLPNQIVDITKNFNLEDNKRNWPRNYTSDELQYSMPLCTNGGIVEYDYKKAYHDCEEWLKSQGTFHIYAKFFQN